MTHSTPVKFLQDPWKVSSKFCRFLEASWDREKKQFPGKSNMWAIETGNSSHKRGKQTKKTKQKTIIWKKKTKKQTKKTGMATKNKDISQKSQAAILIKWREERICANAIWTDDTQDKPASITGMEKHFTAIGTQDNHPNKSSPAGMTTCPDCLQSISKIRMDPELEELENPLSTLMWIKPPVLDSREDS